MDKDKLAAFLKGNSIERVKFAFTDIDGVLRGKVIHVEKLLEGIDAGYGFCDVVFGWDCTDTLYDSVSFTGWHTGFPDKPCFIDPATLRTVPWQNDIPFFLADFSGNGAEQKGGPAANVCPRSLLKKIITECESLGFHPEFAQEFEWFNFRESPATLQQKGFDNLETLTPGMFGYSILRTSQQNSFYTDLFTLLNKFGVTLEGLHTETGPGVYEAAIIHDHALAAADKAVLFKNAVKEIASAHGLTASFMAKWSPGLPGCSGHIHQSLWDAEKSRNLFYDSNRPDKMSDLATQYLAGQLYCLPSIMPMYAPTTNSYKRLVEGAWAPATVSWGVENRTAAIRIINSTESRTRVETRVPGSDSNPYLALAAALASGLYGIKNKLSLQQPAISGNAYQQEHTEPLPSDLEEATHRMQQSDLAKQLFGETFTDHFTATRLWECKQLDEGDAKWELKRYFEII